MSLCYVNAAEMCDTLRVSRYQSNYVVAISGFNNLSCASHCTGERASTRERSHSYTYSAAGQGSTESLPTSLKPPMVAASMASDGMDRAASTAGDGPGYDDRGSLIYGDMSNALAAVLGDEGGGDSPSGGGGMSTRRGSGGSSTGGGGRGGSAGRRRRGSEVMNLDAGTIQEVFHSSKCVSKCECIFWHHCL